MEKMKAALVLSGGGARGIAHIGAIEVIQQHGFEISSISGTSMGAVVGGMYALGKLTEFKEWLYKLDRMKVFELIDFTFSNHGIVKADRVLNTMQEFIKDEKIEDLSIPYAASATDIYNREEVVFTSGSIFDAIRASIAIPSVVTPVKSNERLLVDGGVLNNLPLSNVKRTKDDVLIAVNVNAHITPRKPKISKTAEKEQKKKYQQAVENFQKHLSKIRFRNEKETPNLSTIELLNKTVSMMMQQMVHLSIQQYRPDYLIEVSRDSCSTYDFFKAEELVEIGRMAAEDALKR